MKKKILFMLLITMAGQTNKASAQVYKRIIGIDSIGYSSSYPPYLYKAYRFTYSNQKEGNREEVRGLYNYYLFPSNFYEDCDLYNKFKFTSLKDSIIYGRDTIHKLSRGNGVLSINNYNKVFSNNNRVTAYYNGIDTTASFKYDNNGLLISQNYKSMPYAIKQVTNQYNNQNKKVSTEWTVNNSAKYYFFYKYDNSSNLKEETDSFPNTGFYNVTKIKHTKTGSVLVKNITLSATNSSATSVYDDSLFYNSKGLLSRISRSSSFGSLVKYYYDTSGYMDSVVYERAPSLFDKVILYWETYNPNSSSIGKINISPSNHISLFPNPTSGNLNILLTEKGSNLVIVNSLGQTVREMILEKGMNTIDVVDLAKGIYSLRFGKVNECRKIIIE